MKAKLTIKIAPEDQSKYQERINLSRSLIEGSGNLSFRDLLSEVLNEAKQTRSLSVRQICQATGIREAAISQYLNSKTGLTVETYERFLNALLE